MKPIIMSTEDVRGILDGRRTMARMPIKPQPEFAQVHVWDGKVLYDGGNRTWCWKQHVSPDCWNEIDWLEQFAPYKPGDVLWVRETWRVEAWDDEGSICVDYKADGFTRREWIRISDPGMYEELWQQSSDDARKANASIDDDGNYNWEPGKGPTRWRSPVTMPREAARLFLRVKDVRVERVQDILCGDMKREGVIPKTVTGGQYQQWQNDYFKPAWDARNAKRGYGWDSNPLVCVIEFERTPSGAIGPEPDRTAPNGDKGAGE